MTSILKKAADYADMVKIAHTLFALPFAMSALCLAYGSDAVILKHPESIETIAQLIAALM